ALIGSSPGLGRPRYHHIARDPFGVRHHDREAAVGGSHAGETAGTAVGVVRVLLGGLPAVVDVAQRRDDPARIALLGEVGVAFAVRDRDRHYGARHALHEERGRFRNFNQRQTRLVFFGLVAREARP